MTEREKKTKKREKHPGHKLTVIMKKRKKEILPSKEQSTEQSTAQSAEQSTEQSSVHSTVQSTEQSSVRSNGAYFYGVGMLVVLAIGVCVFFAYNTFKAKNKNKPMKKRINHQNDVICFRKIYNK